MSGADRVIRRSTAGAVLGVAPTLAVNVAHGLGHGLIGDGDPRFPGDITDSAETRDPLGDRAAEVFVARLAADRVPSIRAQLHVGQARAQRLRG